MAECLDHPLRPIKGGDRDDDDTAANVAEDDAKANKQENGSQVKAQKEEIENTSANEQNTCGRSNGDLKRNGSGDNKDNNQSVSDLPLDKTVDDHQGANMQVETRKENKDLEIIQQENCGNDRIRKEEDNQMVKEQIKINHGGTNSEGEKTYPVAEDDSIIIIEPENTHSHSTPLQPSTKARKL